MVDTGEIWRSAGATVEREACAKLVERLGCRCGGSERDASVHRDSCPVELARVIRARGKAPSA